MRNTSTPCTVCSDHDTDLCPGSVPECPAFLDSLDLNAVLALFRFPVSARPQSWIPRSYTFPNLSIYVNRAQAQVDLQDARDDLRAVGIQA